MEFITFIVLMAGLSIPLLYAIATLLGMRRKFFYPLLRFKKGNGSLHPTKVEQ